MSGMLQVQAMDVSYGAVTVLRKIELRVGSAEIVSILGANGAGKTSMLRALSNIVVRRTGTLTLEGRDISKLRSDKIVRLGVAHVPDGRGTFCHLTVEENLRLGAFTRAGKLIGPEFERILTYFPRLKERIKQQAGTLSGGEQQMLAIGRALMLKPKLLLLDEPSFGLAPKIVANIFEILTQINKECQTSIVLVEQNAALALEVSSRAYLLETGRIVLTGEAQALRNDEAVRRVFLGG